MSEGHDASVDSAGTPRNHHLYAVFDAEDRGRKTAGDLEASGLQVQVLHGTDDAHQLRAADAPGHSGGPTARLSRLVKRLGGETAAAERFAVHLELGRTVLAIETESRKTEELVDRLTKDGAYDVIYFTMLGIEYLSPTENAAHNIPAEGEVSADELRGD